MGDANGKGSNGMPKSGMPAQPSRGFMMADPPPAIDESLEHVPTIEASSVLLTEGDDPEEERTDEVPPVSRARTVNAFVRERIDAMRAGAPLPLPPPWLEGKLPTPGQARRAELTRELIDQIVHIMQGGARAIEAAMHLGVRGRQINRWLDLGRIGFSEIAVELLERTEQARATWEAACLASITAGRPNWQARAWLLHQAYPDRYAIARYRPEPGAPPPDTGDGEQRGLVLYLPRLEDEDRKGST